jgi:uncharacterized protein YdeI (YjbR/CyaY-like superfamily)
MPAPTSTDLRVDAYIAAAAPFARPILEHLRAAMHQALPEVAETIKWSRPFFMLDDRILADMAAFKAHCSLGFWKDARPIPADAGGGGLPGRIGSLADLPAAPALRKLIGEAARAARAAQAAPAATRAVSRARREALDVPDDLAAALRAHPAAGRVFDAFAPGQQRDYIEWITEAKRAATRAKRLEEALGWIAEGKTRYWKYKDC